MYKVLIDSCGELPNELKKDDRFCSIPLQLEIDGEFITDDETFDQLDFIKKVASSAKEPHSACPSPEAFMAQINDNDERVYIITLSSGVSGAYNSACLAAQIYKEEHANIDIYVIDSKAASVSETLIALKIKELEEKGLSFEEIKRKINDYTDNLHIYGVLNTLDTFKKSGRISAVKCMTADVLNVKVIIGANNGQLVQLGKARGMKKAIQNMINMMKKEVVEPETKTLAIAYCNCKERAEYVKSLIENTIHVKDIIMLSMSGVSTMYANDGGVLISI